MANDTGITRPLTSRAERALGLSDAAAVDLGDEFVGTEHPLLGLLAGPRCREWRVGRAPLRHAPRVRRDRT